MKRNGMWIDENGNARYGMSEPKKVKEEEVQGVWIDENGVARFGARPKTDKKTKKNCDAVQDKYNKCKIDKIREKEKEEKEDEDDADKTNTRDSKWNERY